MWTESKACTCYGKVTVVAQWTADGRYRLIPSTENQAGIGWKGKVWVRTFERCQYYDSVFNLIAHSEHGYRQQTIEERVSND